MSAFPGILFFSVALVLAVFGLIMNHRWRKGLDRHLGHWWYDAERDTSFWVWEEFIEEALDELNKEFPGVREMRMIIVGAAVKCGDKVWVGQRHANILTRMRRMGVPLHLPKEEGFVDEKGVFYDRMDAAAIVLKTGQISELHWPIMGLDSSEVFPRGTSDKDFCASCGHPLLDNLHGPDQNDYYVDMNLEPVYLGSCTYCKYCKKEAEG